MLRPGIIPLRPLKLGDILDGTIKLIRANPKAVLGLSAIAALLVTVPVAVGQGIMLDMFGTAFANPGDDPTEFGTSLGVLAPYAGELLSSVLEFFVVTVLTGLLTRILGRAVFGGAMTPGEAWRRVANRVPALFGVALLLGIILVAPMLLLILLIIAIGTAGGFDGDAVGGVITLIVLFMLAYVAYAVFFWTRFCLAAPAVVLEGRGPIEGMRRSWQLVRGDFWRVFGVQLLTAILVAIMAFIVAIPFSLLGTVFGMLGAGSTVSAIAATVFIGIGGTIAAMISYPVTAGVSGLLYADRRMRSEAFDLVLQTAAIEQQRQGWVHASADDLWHPSNSPRP
ncbi:glycerophosphoryl diester phosphodiesterase membrane domain-containing protein [Nonomuraea antri]|uniref:glycerophosphoryl diester phosphodiesterase membrane domain-containing protein n=1 Tax=Nonomuraea antri TaxID=2730852 RepID=UPI002E29B58E|nr:glycerophosphoryl diester phosphodiesterase membrane domain-containing protein [Nonomuraea antri]